MGSKYFLSCHLQTDKKKGGVYFRVKLGIDIATNQHVALKIMDRDGISDRQIEKLRREITSMQSLDHPVSFKNHSKVN